jgi:hypothetical protein
MPFIILNEVGVLRIVFFFALRRRALPQEDRVTVMKTDLDSRGRLSLRDSAYLTPRLILLLANRPGLLRHGLLALLSGIRV